MTRIRAVLLALALSVAATLAAALVIPGVANAYPQRPAANQQAINQVIARALTQRGVPFTYGGGDANGPTKGVPQAPQTAPDAPSALPGFPSPTTPTLAPVPGLVLAPTAPAAGLAAPNPVTAPDPQSNVVGFDASGIIVYAFAGVGVKMPRSSGEQYKVSQKVAPSQALPGDLIFYGPEGAQSVALFLGNGQMLEASPPAVTISAVRTEGMTPYLGRIIL